MPTINLAYIAELVLKYARQIGYSVLLTFFYASIVIMWTSFVTAFLYFYGKFELLLNSLSGTGLDSSSDFIQSMYGLLNCVGFIPAFNDTRAVLVSAISFLIGRILFSVTLKTYKIFLDTLNPLIR